MTHGVGSCSGCVPACGELENASWRLCVGWAGPCGLGLGSVGCCVWETQVLGIPSPNLPLGMHTEIQPQSMSPQIVWTGQDPAVPGGSMGPHLALPSSALKPSPGGSILSWAPCPALGTPSSPSLSLPWMHTQAPPLRGGCAAGTVGFWDAWTHQAGSWEAASLSPTSLLFSQGSEIHSGVAAEHL